MTRDNDVTPARRLSSIQKMKIWGMIHLWLAEQQGIRNIELDVGARGLRVIVHNPLSDRQIDQTRVELVGSDEDPHRAIMRVLSRMNTDEPDE